MNDPNNPLRWEVWRRGGQLGLWLAAVFFGVTLALYLLLAVAGWELAARVLGAVCVGPMLATGLIAAWWVFVARRRLAGVDDGNGDWD